MYSHYHILVGGFTQKYASPTNGLSACKYQLDKVYGSGNGLTCVDYLPWHVDAGDYAHWCYEYGTFRTGKPSGVTIAGYSKGGYTAAKMANAFQGLGVRNLYLCLVDPVFGFISSFARWVRVNVSSNVTECVWYRQKHDWPRSHRVVTESDKTSLVDHMVTDLSHDEFDNSIDVRQTIMRQAAAVHT